MAEMYAVHFSHFFQAVETTKVQPVLFCCFATAITSFCPQLGKARLADFSNSQQVGSCFAPKNLRR
jgi:hypothetical protein